MLAYLRSSGIGPDRPISDAALAIAERLDDPALSARDLVHLVDAMRTVLDLIHHESARLDR